MFKPRPETYVLNIGLARRDAPDLSSLDVLATLRGAGFLVNPNDNLVAVAVYESDTEPTLVVTVSIAQPRFVGAVWEVCRALGQDCIAVWPLERKIGGLFGPFARNWGEFDPAKFILPGGARLAPEFDDGIDIG